MITADSISNMLPADIRQFIVITSIDFSSDMEPVVASLVEAINIIAGKIRINRKIHIIISSSPFRLILGNGVMTFALNNSAIHGYVEDFIFLDFNKAKCLPTHLQIAGFLEELAHVLMNVTDEQLVPHVVQLLYPRIRVNEKGQYTQV